MARPRARTPRLPAPRRRPNRQGGIIPERREVVARAAIERRVRAEFEELPGMRLTLSQVVRLLGLPEDACKRILRGLICEGLVTCTADGRYANERVERERAGEAHHDGGGWWAL